MTLASDAPDIATQIGSATSLEAVGEVVRTAARRLMQADGATFVLREDDRCFYADEDSIAPLWKGQRFPMTECISGWAMLNEQTAVVPDITVDDRIPQAAYRPTYVRSLVMVPIGSHDPVGAIGVYWARKRQATPDEVLALEHLAAAVADAVDEIGLHNAPWAPTFR